MKILYLAVLASSLVQAENEPASSAIPLPPPTSELQQYLEAALQSVEDVTIDEETHAALKKHLEKSLKEVPDEVTLREHLEASLKEAQSPSIN